MSSPARPERLNFRLEREQKLMIEKAAAMAGQTVSDFALSCMLKAAQQTIQDATTTRLTLRDRDAFLKLLDGDSEPNSALRRAAGRYRKRRA